MKTTPFVLVPFVSLLVLGGLASGAFAEANYVYHERTTANPGSGGQYVTILNPTSAQNYPLRFKVEYQFFTDQARVYYTTDGSTPSGTFGIPSGTTSVLTGAYVGSFGGPVVDVVGATIPAQPAGTTVKYIVSAWHSGGGAEIFANGPGSPCACGAPTSSSALATVFQYTVHTPAVTGVTGGSPFVFNNQGFTVGYEFTVSQNITVDSLGFYDHGNDGLATAHEVGIYDLCGVLRTSGTVPSGTTAASVNGYRYGAVTPVVLGAGTYRIGTVVFHGGGNDAFLWFASAVATDASVTFVKGVINNGVPVLQFPYQDATATGLAEKCCFGPNFTFVPGGTPPGAPESNVRGNNVSIVDGDPSPDTGDHTDFGSTAVTGGTVVRTFTIENTGTADLTVSSLSKSGTHAADFTLGALTPAGPIPAGNSATFTVTFDPSATGARAATIAIANNDCDENPYDFAIQGTGTVPGKALDFDGVDDHILANSTSSFFGTTPTTIEFWCKPAAPMTFIMDLGFTYQLRIDNGGNRFGISGFFLGASDSGATVVPGVWQHFAVTYDGVNTFRFYKNGVPTPNPVSTGTFGSYPQVANAQLRVGLANNNYFYKGAVDEVRVWREQRTDAQILANYQSEITGMDPCLDIYLKLNHGLVGENNAGVTTATDTANAVAANGSLNNFALTGSTGNWVDGAPITEATSAYVPAPEINLQGNSVSIVDGDSTPSATDHTSFGTVNVGNSFARTYTIQNTGNLDLNVSDITLTGNNAGDFAVSGISLPAVVAQGGSTTFTVTVTPTAGSGRNAVIHVSNDDCDEADYNFAVQATGLAAPTVTTTSESGVTTTTAVLGGNVTDNGGATVTERGIVWGLTANPTTADTKVANGSGNGVFSATVTGLPSGTTIHVRAYAINSVGPSYGGDISFTTLNTPPTVAADAGSKLFIARYQQNKIARANVDGTGLNLDYLVSTGGTIGVAVDTVGGKLFWTDIGGKIGRANLDGSGADPNFITGLSSPVGLAVDSLNGHLYIGDAAVKRVNLDGTGLTTLIPNLNIGGYAACSDVALDVANNKLYYVFGEKIGRANLDGSSHEPNFIVTPANGLVGLGLDLVNGKIYWAQSGTSAIGRANLDGTGVQNSFLSVSGPRDVIVDPQAAKVFWSNGGGVGRANLDGTGVNESFLPGVSGSWGIAVGDVDTEGALTTRTGTYSDPDGNTVTFSANLGSVTKTGTSSGTWTWTYTPPDGPATHNVTITANDGTTTSTTSFTLNVNNIAPTATFSRSAATANENTVSPPSVSFTGQTDPGTTDVSTGLKYSYDYNYDGTWDDGDGTYAGSLTAATKTIPASYFAAPAPASLTVKGRILDEDGGSTDYTAIIAINHAPTAINGPLTIVEDFDYGASAGTLSGNGGAGFSSAWNGGSYTPAGLTFSSLTSPGGAWNGSSGSRNLAATLAAAGPITGDFLFSMSSAPGGRVQMFGLGGFNNQNFTIALAPANDSTPTGGIPIVGLQGGGYANITPGAVALNTTYLYRFSYAGSSISAWILTGAQYDHFAPGGLTDAELNAAGIGTGATQVTGRVTKTGSVSSNMANLFTYTFGGSGVIMDRLRMTGQPVGASLVVAENAAINTSAGTLLASDADSGNTFTYALVSGTGDTDNASFNLSGTTLRTSAVFDYETMNSYSLRVRVTDQGGLFYETPLTVTISNVNEAPVVARANANVPMSEGSVATNSGTFSDPEGNATVTLTSSIGTVTPNNGGGTWNWSHTPADGPAGPTTVTITATDNGVTPLVATATFTLTVNNVAPTIALTGNSSVDVNTSYTLNLGTIADPGTDTVTGYSIDWGDGNTENFPGIHPTGLSKTHTYTVSGSKTITVALTDEDGTHAGAGTKSLNVLPDTDGDGNPDSSDPDDDNDGVPDGVEIANGTDPLDDVSTPAAGLFALDSVSQLEGNTGTTSFTFTATYTGAPVGAGFSVGVATADASAVDPGDYAAVGGTVSFPTGATGETAMFTVGVVTDVQPELNETFGVNLGDGATVATGTGTILDDDSLLITEIMYNPDSNENDWEWIEVYNPSTSPINLAGWAFDDDDGTPLAAANIAAGIVPPGTSAILFDGDALTPAQFAAAWGAGLNLIPVTGFPTLGNTGCHLGLWASFGSYDGGSGGAFANASDQVDFGALGFPASTNGVSIYLTDLSSSVDNALGAHWAPSAVGGATPVFTGYSSANLGGNTGHDTGSPGDPDLVANGDAGTTTEDAVLSSVNPGATASLLANDLGLNPAVTSFDAASALGATVSVNPNGTFSYNPTTVTAFQVLDAGDSVNDTFTYTITETIGGFTPGPIPVEVYDGTSSGMASADVIRGSNTTGAPVNPGQNPGPDSILLANIGSNGGTQFPGTRSAVPAPGGGDSYAVFLTGYLRIDNSSNPGGTWTFGSYTDDNSRLRIDLDGDGILEGSLSALGGIANETVMYQGGCCGVVLGPQLAIPNGVYFFEAAFTEGGGLDYAEFFYAPGQPPFTNTNYALIGDASKGISSGPSGTTTDTATVTLTVTGVNDQPTLTPPGIADITLFTSSPSDSVALFPAFADIDADDIDSALTYTVTGNTNPALIQPQSVDSADGLLVLDTPCTLVGSAEITVRATDPGGLWVEDTFTVTVTDDVPPVLMAKDIVLSVPAGFSVTADFSGVTALDKVDGPLPVTCTPDDSAPFPLGVYVINCQATDLSGNTGMASFRLFVLEIAATPGMPAIPAPVAVTGTPAPGAGGPSGLPAAAVLSNPTRLYLNDAGDAAFEASLLGVPAANNAAVFSVLGGVTTPLAVKGVGGVSSFNFLSLAPDGDTSFRSDTGADFLVRSLDGGGADSPGFFPKATTQALYQHAKAGGTDDPVVPGIFKSVAGVTALTDSFLSTPSLLVQEGDPVTAVPGATYGQIKPRAVAGSSGATAFACSLRGVPLNAAEAVFSGPLAGPFALVAREGDTVPDTGGAVFGGFSAESINGAGRLALKASLRTGGAVTTLNNDVLLTNRNGFLELLAREGSPAPCVATPGVVFGSFREVFMGDDGSVVFLAFLTGAVGSGNDGTLWRSDASGAIHLLAREGEAANNTEGIHQQLLDASASASGRAAFRARLIPGLGDATTANALGLWAENPTVAVPQLVARQGDTFELAPGDTRTLTGITLDATANAQGGSGGYGRVLGDGGHVAARLSLTGNASGAFVLDILP